MEETNAQIVISLKEDLVAAVGEESAARIRATRVIGELRGEGVSWKALGALLGETPGLVRYRYGPKRGPIQCPGQLSMEVTP